MKIINMILCVGITVTPLLADAGDLKIANNTKLNLSFKVNNICSDKFGVVSANTIKTILEKDFNKECETNPKICRTIIYSKPNCEDEAIGEVGFDVSYGVSFISGSTSYPRVSITGNGFNLFIVSALK